MWYAFVPGNRCLQDSFCGYTNNLAIFLSYEQMMGEFGVKNIMEITEFDTDLKCLSAMTRLLKEFPNYGDYNDGADVLAMSSRLTSIRSNIDQSITVINDIAYERFAETVYSVREIQKMMSSLYSLCSTYSMQVTCRYLLMNQESKTIIELMGRILEIWKTYKTCNDGMMTSMMRINPASKENTSYLWSLFDESRYLRLWVMTEVVRRLAYHGIPRKMWDMDY